MKINKINFFYPIALAFGFWLAISGRINWWVLLLILAFEEKIVWERKK